MTSPIAGTSQAAVSAGSTFQGRYEVQGEIGRGGFGTVFKACQLATGQSVAIKVLRALDQPGPLWDRRLGRFAREMRMCADLHHPNIVRLIDSGHLDGGPPFTVFEFVPGDTLADILAREGSLAPLEAKHLMLQVLDALATAHARGIVHRDLKPKNLMVTTGARRNVLVLDFGIGAITRGGEESDDLTVSGEMLGSPGYAAPEQFLGGPATPRSDIFSWGLVLLECLTGGAAREPLHRAVMTRLDPDPVALPDALAAHPIGAILSRALVKDAAARDVTAEELLRDLEACDVRDLPAELVVASSRAVVAQASVTPAPVSATQEMTLSTRAPIRRERRQVTVVCCGLHVRTPAAMRTDYEDADELLDAIQRLAAQAARRFGGATVAATPEAVVLCFGFPIARDDDAVRAVRAGLAIKADLDALASTRAPHAAGVEVGIGVHTGLVVARDLDQSHAMLGPVVGTAVSLAMRIASAAKPGDIFVSDTTRRLTEVLFEYESAGAVSGSDDSSRTEVAILRGVRVGVSAPASIRRTPLVGRQREATLLADLGGRARRRDGCAVLVHGEAGIGKSRLTHEVIAGLEHDGFAVLEGRCTPDTVNSAFYPVVDALERTLELGRYSNHPRTSEVETTRRIEALVRSYRLDPQTAVPIFANLLGVAIESRYRVPEVLPGKLKEMTTELLLSTLFEMAESQPTVLLVEDVHWADPSTLELLGKAAGEVAGSGLLMVLTARPEFVPGWSPSSVTSLPLGRLERSEVERLISNVAQEMALPSRVIESVVERTDGVPLFVEELVSAMLGSGDLVARSRSYELAQPLSEIDVPVSLRASLTAKLDRLGPAKHTAQTAAVIGREFRLDVLVALSSRSAAEVRADVAALAAADLLFVRRRLREPTYMFKHALVRDSAYELMPRDTRQQLHARLASLLETEFAGTVRPEVQARHHAAAGQVPQAVGFALQACGQGLQRSANAEVIAIATEATGWLRGIEDEKARATSELSLNGLRTLALMSTLGYGQPEVARAIARSEELLPLVGPGPLATGTIWASFLYHHVRAERAKARALASSLVQTAEATDDVDLLVVALSALGQCHYFEGSLRDSRDVLLRMVSLYDPERHRGQAITFGLDPFVFANSTLCLVRWLLGERNEGRAHGQAAVERARALPHAYSEAFGLLYCSGIPHYERDHAGVRRVTQELTAIVDRHGLLMLKAFCGILQGWADKNAALALDCITGLRMSGQEIALSYWLSLVAECEASAGDYGGALARIEECLAHARSTGEHYYEPELLRLKGTWLLELGRTQEPASEECLRLALDMATRSGQRPAALRAAVALGEFLKTTGRPDEGRDHVSRACAAFGPGDDWEELRVARSGWPLGP